VQDFVHQQYVSNGLVQPPLSESLLGLENIFKDFGSTRGTYQWDGGIL